MNYDIDTLNEVQKQALLCDNNAILVTAGAGSGKTRLLTHKVIYLINEKGVKPWEILAITFTNKATNEMKERITSMCDSAKSTLICTFHSLCVRILRRDIDKLDGYTKDFSIYSDSDITKILKEVYDELYISDDKLKKHVEFHISNRKNKNLSYSNYLDTLSFENDAKIILKAMQKYDEKLKNNNALDFDDLLIKCYELLTNNKEVLDFYTEKFKYILVDEFQDTNKVQYDILKLISSKYKNVFAVGDEDQCIYSWRGANISNILNFTKDFENVKIFKLEQNYRSTKNILELANKLIKSNTSRLDKKLWTENSKVGVIENYQASNEVEEAEYIARNIYYLIQNGYNSSDIVVLMRINALTRLVEEKLRNYNINYKIYGGFKFYERAEVKNLIAYLRLFVNSKDNISYLRIINFPKRGIGDSFIAKLSEYAESKNMSLLESTLSLTEQDGVLFTKLKDFKSKIELLKEYYENLKPDDFVAKVVSTFEIKNFYKDGTEEGFNKIANIDSFIASVQEFVELNENASLSEFLQSVSLSSSEDNDNSDQVVLATIHAVKGLEFKVVFVMGLEEKLFPISRAFNNESDMEEERRLCYVAITRAKERLFLTRCKTRYLYNKRDFCIDSRFLKEIGLNLGFKLEDNVAFKPTESKYDYNMYNCKTTTKSNSISNGNVRVAKTFNSYENESDEEFKNNKFEDFIEGMTLEHPRYGIGVLETINNVSKAGVINFELFGKKLLMLEIAPLKIIK